MRIYRVDRDSGRTIEEFGSANAVVSRIAYLRGEAMVNCMYLAPASLVGLHQAASGQLFLVIQGHGWARGRSLEKMPIKAGEAAYWEAGEWHETGSATGMTAIVIESPSLNPDEFLKAAH